VTIGDTPAGVDQLVGAFTALAAQHPPRPAPPVPPPLWRPGPVPEQALSPREAFFAPSRRVRLQDAAGEVAAELVVPYPPGIPALAPGR
jgi:Orn/Lys/Arg decarboxylase, C-terminal domain